MREAGHDVDIRTQSGVTIWCQVRSGEDDKGEGGAEKGRERCQSGLGMTYGRSGPSEKRDIRSGLGITYYKELWVVGEKRWG